MHNITFEHQKEEITLIRKEKTNLAILYMDFFEDAQKQLEKFGLNFSCCNPFLSWPSATKDT